MIGGLLLAGSVSAQVIVTPDNPQGWGPSVGPNGNVEITGTQPRNGNGSLELSTAAGAGDWSRLYQGNPWGPGAPLGLLSMIDVLAFDWMRSDASTTASHYTPACRLHIRYDGVLHQELVWEGVYNGYGVAPTNAWVFEDMMNATFHTAGGTVFKTLAQWQAELPMATAQSLNVGVGSGWSGDYLGFADMVTIGFGDGDETTWNFETTPQVVPEPMLMILLGTGLVGVAAARRRRNRREDV